MRLRATLTMIASAAMLFAVAALAHADVNLKFISAVAYASSNTLELTVQNTGNTNSGDFTYAYNMGYLGTFPGIPAGQTVTETISFGVDPYNLPSYCQIDLNADGMMVPIDPYDGDNWGSVTFVLGADVDVLSASYNRTPVRGREFKPMATIYSYGPDEAENVTVTYYACDLTTSDSAVIGTENLGTVYASETVISTCPVNWTYPDDGHSYGIRVEVSSSTYDFNLYNGMVDLNLQ